MCAVCVCVWLFIPIFVSTVLCTVVVSIHRGSVDTKNNALYILLGCVFALLAKWIYSRCNDPIDHLKTCLYNI